MSTLPYAKLIFGLVVLSVFSYLYVPFRDSIYGVPFVINAPADSLREKGFTFNASVSCNRFYEREIGFTINPPIQIESVGDAYLAISGKAQLLIKQGTKTLERDVNLVNTGWSLSAEGVRSKIISRYEPIGSIFCGTQDVLVNVRDLNFDPRKHTVKVYVSRDRRH